MKGWLFPHLLDHNIYDPVYRDKFLLIGTCVPRLYPTIMERFDKEWGNVAGFCLEQFHYNQMVSKLFSILALGKTQRVGFLTVDGSPHCLQMHFASKYLTRGLKPNVEFEHFVISKGKIYRITTEEIDRAKDLAIRGQEVC